jgi:DNA-binding NarL/FixJ family response regulator
MSKALIVEDFKLISDMWKSLLLEVGFTDVFVTYCFEDVENYINASSPEIILMDLNLPTSKNGIEMTSWLIEQNKTLNIIILTIHNDPSIIKRAFEAGARGFVTKNSGLKEIKVAIQKIMGGEKYLCQEALQYSYLLKP